MKTLPTTSKGKAHVDLVIARSVNEFIKSLASMDVDLNHRDHYGLYDICTQDSKRDWRVIRTAFEKYLCYSQRDSSSLGHSWVVSNIRALAEVEFSFENTLRFVDEIYVALGVLSEWEPIIKHLSSSESIMEQSGGLSNKSQVMKIIQSS